jgi:hypothetical protein
MLGRRPQQIRQLELNFVGRGHRLRQAGHERHGRCDRQRRHQDANAAGHLDLSVQATGVSWRGNSG